MNKLLIPTPGRYVITCPKRLDSRESVLEPFECILPGEEFIDDAHLLHTLGSPLVLSVWRLTRMVPCNEVVCSIKSLHEKQRLYPATLAELSILVDSFHVIAEGDAAIYRTLHSMKYVALGKAHVCTDGKRFYPTYVRRNSGTSEAVKTLSFVWEGQPLEAGFCVLFIENTFR